MISLRSELNLLTSRLGVCGEMDWDIYAWPQWGREHNKRVFIFSKDFKNLLKDASEAASKVTSKDRVDMLSSEIASESPDGKTKFEGDADHQKELEHLTALRNLILTTHV